MGRSYSWSVASMYGVVGWVLYIMLLICSFYLMEFDQTDETAILHCKLGKILETPVHNTMFVFPKLLMFIVCSFSFIVIWKCLLKAALCTSGWQWYKHSVTLHAFPIDMSTVCMVVVRKHKNRSFVIKQLISKNFRLISNTSLSCHCHPFVRNAHRTPRGQIYDNKVAGISWWKAHMYLLRMHHLNHTLH